VEANVEVHLYFCFLWVTENWLRTVGEHMYRDSKGKRQMFTVEHI